jgi:hypothetical protein
MSSVICVLKTWHEQQLGLPAIMRIALPRSTHSWRGVTLISWGFSMLHIDTENPPFPDNPLENLWENGKIHISFEENRKSHGFQ